MKKTLIPFTSFRFAIRFLTLLVSSSALASSYGSFEVAGQLQLLSSVSSLPSSKQGQSAFSLSSLRLEVLRSLTKDMDVSFQVEGAEHRDATNKEFQWNLKQAYLSYAFGDADQEINYGMIPNWLYTQNKEMWPFQIWSTKSQMAVQRFGLIPESDLGLQWTKDLDQDEEEWGLQISNGEGQLEEENSPQKEFAIFMRKQLSNTIDILSYISYGKYGNVTSDADQKIRAILQLQHQYERLKAELLLFYASTPADIVRSQKLFDGTDVLAKSGALVASHGAELATQYKWAEDSSVLLKVTAVNAAVELSEHSMWDAFLGEHKEFSSEVDFVAGYQYQHYGSSYFLASKDQDLFLVSTRVLF